MRNDDKGGEIEMEEDRSWRARDWATRHVAVVYTSDSFSEPVGPLEPGNLGSGVWAG